MHVLHGLNCPTSEVADDVSTAFRMTTTIYDTGIERSRDPQFSLDTLSCLFLALEPVGNPQKSGETPGLMMHVGVISTVAQFGR